MKRFLWSYQILEFVCVVCLQQGLWSSALFESLLLGACRSAQKSIFAERKICSVDLCLNALNIIILFFFLFYFSFPAQILEPKNLFCDSNVSQPYL